MECSPEAVRHGERMRRVCPSEQCWALLVDYDFTLSMEGNFAQIGTEVFIIDCM